MATKEGHVRVIHEFKDGKKKNGQFGGLYILGNTKPLEGSERHLGLNAQSYFIE